MRRCQRACGQLEDQPRTAEPVRALGGVNSADELARSLVLPPGGFVVAARIIMHGAGMIAARGPIGSGEISDAVGEVGVGIAQSLGIAAVAEASRGRELDLHQPDGAAASDQARLIAAFPQDHAMHQTFRHVVGLGVNGNESVELGISGLDAC